MEFSRFERTVANVCDEDLVIQYGFISFPRVRPTSCVKAVLPTAEAERRAWGESRAPVGPVGRERGRGAGGKPAAGSAASCSWPAWTVVRAVSREKKHKRSPAARRCSLLDALLVSGLEKYVHVNFFHCLRGDASKESDNEKIDRRF